MKINPFVFFLLELRFYLFFSKSLDEWESTESTFQAIFEKLENLVCLCVRQTRKAQKKQDGHLNPDLFRISETLFQFVLWYILWNPCNSKKVTMHPCCSEWWYHLISHLPSTDGFLVFCLPSFSPILVQEVFLVCRSVINELGGTSTRATVALISLISFSEIKKKIVEFFSSAYNGKISL